MSDDILRSSLFYKFFFKDDFLFYILLSDLMSKQSKNLKKLLYLIQTQRNQNIKICGDTNYKLI